jgi:hypothetical protein
LIGAQNRPEDPNLEDADANDNMLTEYLFEFLSHYPLFTQHLSNLLCYLKKHKSKIVFLKTSLNGILPALAATFKWQQVSNVSET